eukprot:scaffold197_cov220-Prasinococcus_capsulatus_cf.AAC.1
MDSPATSWLPVPTKTTWSKHTTEHVCSSGEVSVARWCCSSAPAMVVRLNDRMSSEPSPASRVAPLSAAEPSPASSRCATSCCSGAPSQAMVNCRPMMAGCEYTCSATSVPLVQLVSTAVASPAWPSAYAAGTSVGTGIVGHRPQSTCRRSRNRQGRSATPTASQTNEDEITQQEVPAANADGSASARYLAEFRIPSGEQWLRAGAIEGVVRRVIRAIWHRTLLHLRLVRVHHGARRREVPQGVAVVEAVTAALSNDAQAARERGQQ